MRVGKASKQGLYHEDRSSVLFDQRPKITVLMDMVRKSFGTRCCGAGTG